MCQGCNLLLAMAPDALLSLVMLQARTGFCWCSMSDIAPQGIHFNVRYDIFATDLGVFRDIKEEINFLILEALPHMLATHSVPSSACTFWWSNHPSLVW